MASERRARRHREDGDADGRLEAAGQAGGARPRGHSGRAHRVGRGRRSAQLAQPCHHEHRRQHRDQRHGYRRADHGHRVARTPAGAPGGAAITPAARSRAARAGDPQGHLAAQQRAAATLPPARAASRAAAGGRRRSPIACAGDQRLELGARRHQLGRDPGLARSAPAGRRWRAAAPTRTRRRTSPGSSPSAAPGGGVAAAPATAASMPSSWAPLRSCRPRIDSASWAVRGRRRAISISVASLISHDGGQVAPAGLALAPRGHGHQRAELLPPQPPAPADPAPGGVRILHQRRALAVALLELLVDPRLTALASQPRAAARRRRRAGSGRRRPRTRPAAGVSGRLLPVGEALVVAQRTPTACRAAARATSDPPYPAKPAGELRVEHVARAHVVSAGRTRPGPRTAACITFSTAASAMQLRHRLERGAGQRVDHREPGRGRQLDQAQRRRVGALPHELGVDGADALGARLVEQPAERRTGGDLLELHGHGAVCAWLHNAGACAPNGPAGIRATI